MIEQRSDAWYEARRGVPTASGFSKIMTSKLRPSKSATVYMNELMLEKLGRPVTKFYENAAMANGVASEPFGVAAFELVTGIETEEAGFMLSECGRFGASPDRIWGDGVLELKCPLEKTHMEYLKRGVVPAKYMLQLRGQMLVAKKKHGWFCSYHPNAQPLVVKLDRCPTWDAEFLCGMELFLTTLQARFETACNNLFS